MKNIFLIVNALFISEFVFSQDWSYDTLANKEIKRVEIYRSIIKNDSLQNDSTLKAVRHYSNGLKIFEVYYRNVSDSIWYFYNDNKQLEKVIDCENCNSMHRRKVTMHFIYNENKQNVLKICLDKNLDTLKKTYFLREYNERGDLLFENDSSVSIHNELSISKTKFIYDSAGNFIDTIHYLFGDTNKASMKGLRSFSNPNISYNKNLLGDPFNMKITHKGNLIDKIYYYKNEDKIKLDYIDKYLYY